MNPWANYIHSEKPTRSASTQRWTKEEDQRLREGLEAEITRIYNLKNPKADPHDIWGRISHYHVQNRSAIGCKKRAYRLKLLPKNGPFLLSRRGIKDRNNCELRIQDDTRCESDK